MLRDDRYLGDPADRLVILPVQAGDQQSASGSGLREVWCKTLSATRSMYIYICMCMYVCMYEGCGDVEKLEDDGSCLIEILAR